VYLSGFGVCPEQTVTSGYLFPVNITGGFAFSVSYAGVLAIEQYIAVVGGVAVTTSAAVSHVQLLSLGMSSLSLL